MSAKESPMGIDPYAMIPYEELEGGEWKTAACMTSNSAVNSRCLLKAYVKDGVPVRLKGDEDTPDTLECPQCRACPRGRAMISHTMAENRIKYPMKRKHWSPEEPNGHLRGRDEWVRISWDEALDIAASEMKKVIDKYGTRGIFCASYGNQSPIDFDYLDGIFNVLGGAIHAEMGTVSYGAWPIVEKMMMGTLFDKGPDFYNQSKCKLHVFYGCNWIANKSGSYALRLEKLRSEYGCKVIVIDPWLNQTIRACTDEWIPIRPGTDTAFTLGMAYHQITNNLHDQNYLDTYCIGFDADHMPEGAPVKENFKDYVLGTYDGEPKTPEWAAKICGIPPEKIRSLAEEISACESVDFFSGWSTTKIPNGEQWAQTFYTFALMHGGLGSSRTYASCRGGKEGPGTMWLWPGDMTDGKNNPKNPLFPAGYIPAIWCVPNWGAIEDNSAWDQLPTTEVWQNILDGEYGHEEWPGGKRKLDIHLIYTGGYMNALNSYPNVNAGIEAFRKVDFVWGAHPYYCTTAQYCDVLVPVATWWEKGEVVYGSNEVLIWADQVMEPLGEAKPESYIAREIAKRLGVSEKEANIVSDEYRTYLAASGAIYTDPETLEIKKLIAISQDDLDAWGVEGSVQDGMFTVAEMRERGMYKIERGKGGDRRSDFDAYAAFYNDPVGNPLKTPSGKFEIYSAALAATINSFGFSHISPIPKWQPSAEQGQGAQTEEWPLLLFTPHGLHHAHTAFDNVYSLREAYPNECFINPVDARERGIENGDFVLISSPYGKCLQPAKVMPGIVQGAVAMYEGSWTCIDEETGIDIGGNPNTLQAPRNTGQGITPWTGTLVQVEKYTGDIECMPYKMRPLVMPAGIEEER